MQREDIILVGRLKNEILASDGDLVRIYAVLFPEVHKSVCFFKKIFNENSKDLVQLEFINGEIEDFEINKIGFLEVIARKETRCYDILVDALLKRRHLEKKLEGIERNILNLLNTDKK